MPIDYLQGKLVHLRTLLPSPAARDALWLCLLLVASLALMSSCKERETSIYRSKRAIKRGEALAAEQFKAERIAIKRAPEGAVMGPEGFASHAGKPFEVAMGPGQILQARDLAESLEAIDWKGGKIPKDQSGEGLSQGGHFWVRFAPEPNPIPFQEIFSLRVEVFEAADGKRGAPAEGASLDQVRAVMPAHKHGMKVEPTIKSLGGGVFAVDGMRFHMRGEAEHGRWVLELLINHNGRIEQAKFPLQCCREERP